MIWNILGLAVLLISFTVIAFPEIIILLITLIKPNVKIYSLKDNKYLVISKRKWKEYRQTNNIGFWSQYSLVSVTNIINQNHLEVNLENISVQNDHEENNTEIKDISKTKSVKTKRNLKDIDLDIMPYLNKSTDDEQDSNINASFEENNFEFVKSRLADRNSKQNTAKLNKVNLSPDQRREYDDLQETVKLENNGEANFGVDFNKKIIFIDKLYESKGFDRVGFNDLSDVEIDQKNVNNVNFIKKDGDKVQTSFAKYSVSDEEKKLDSIILKQLVLKIKSEIS
ncbi:hypothetical protein [Lactobacillus hominis]|uniref:hypothetical protein n=1 Tax=Lactobacillus hominis TaxID=1203033 RepID=UPI0023F054A2|nr:hypothetical protein [Lactobacillus hominis]